MSDSRDWFFLFCCQEYITTSNNDGYLRARPKQLRNEKKGNRPHGLLTEGKSGRKIRQSLLANWQIYLLLFLGTHGISQHPLLSTWASDWVLASGMWAEKLVVPSYLFSHTPGEWRGSKNLEKGRALTVKKLGFLTGHVEGCPTRKRLKRLWQQRVNLYCFNPWRLQIDLF